MLKKSLVKSELIRKLAAAISMSLITSASYTLELEEILVTAERKEQNLQEVPLAISVLEQDFLEKNDTHNLSGIAVMVPGLTFSPFAPGQNIVALRGASSNDDGAGTDSSVAVFVDDIYLGRISNINPELFDLERVEVLRGPQGTLYGKNTIGGAINIISTRPDTEKIHGKLRVNLGNFENLDLSALVTGPLNERWAGKISLSRRSRDGWINNKSLNLLQKDDRSSGIRAQLLYSNGSFEALFSADYNNLDVRDMGRVPVSADYNNGKGGDNPATFRPGYEAVCGDIYGSKCVAGTINGYAQRDAKGSSARLSWELDAGLKLISISAYRGSKSDWNMDSTGSPDLVLIDDILDTSEQYSQELRLVSTRNDRLNYVLGLWYLNEETDRAECFDLSIGSDCTLITEGVNDGSDYYRQINETNGFAIFGQLDWAIGEAWTLTLGSRYSYEEKVIENTALAGDFVIINNDFNISLKDSWNALTPKISLNYALNDTNYYLSISRGFKSGGFPAAPQGIEDTASLDQEEATNHEFGIKSDITSNFRLNVAAFLTQYQGLQIQSFGPRPDSTGTDTFGVFQTFNAGSAEAKGTEIEAIWILPNELVLSGFIAFMGSQFGQTDVANSGCCANQEGQDLIRTPELKYAINANQKMLLKGGSEIVLSLNYSFTSDQRGELEPYAIQPEFNLLNARVAWTSRNNKTQLTLWGKNLTDTQYISHLYTVSSSVVAVFGDPRMYGISGEFRF